MICRVCQKPYSDKEQESPFCSQLCQVEFSANAAGVSIEEYLSEPAALPMPNLIAALELEAYEKLMEEWNRYEIKR